MAQDVVVLGGAQWARLARAMRKADPRMLSEIPRAMAKAERPLLNDVRAALGDYLPNRFAAELRPGLRSRSRRRGGRSPGITLEPTARTSRGKPRALAALNKGSLGHPLFGNRRFWFDQPVKPAFFGGPIVAHASRVEDELSNMLEELAEYIAAQT